MQGFGRPPSPGALCPGAVVVQFDISSFINGPNIVALQVLLMLTMVLVHIVLLNMMIAHMSDIYAKITAQAPLPLTCQIILSCMLKSSDLKSKKLRMMLYF